MHDERKIAGSAKRGDKYNHTLDEAGLSLEELSTHFENETHVSLVLNIYIYICYYLSLRNYAIES
jgi:hypothetical protein